MTYVIQDQQVLKAYQDVVLGPSTYLTHPPFKFAARFAAEIKLNF